MNEQDQNEKSATQVLDNVKSMMLSNAGYTPTSIDFLVLSGITTMQQGFKGKRKDCVLGELSAQNASFAR